MLGKFLLLLFALIMISVGIRSIFTRRAGIALNQSDPNSSSELIVEGFPAILVGIFEIGIGIFVLINRHTPW